MTITDEMVEKASLAMVRLDADVGHKPSYRKLSRAALEAVAPALIAQGVLEAAKIYWDGDDGERDWQPTLYPYEAMIARAQELDPK